MRRARAFLGVAGLAMFAAACSEQPGLGPIGSGGPRAPAQIVASIKCTAQVPTATVTCEPLQRMQAAGAGRIIIGGQGTYVLLSSSGTAYTAVDSTFQTNVTVQNRSNQPMGTSDGDFFDGSGVRVFFFSGPTVTGGTGPATVFNPDSLLDITGTAQPTFVYGQKLLPGAVSSPKNWKFKVAPSVTTFTFQVEISTAVPMSDGVLRWRTSGAAIRGMSCSSQTFCFAVGDAGAIQAWNGTSWSTSSSGSFTALNAVSTFSSTAAMAVGSGGMSIFWNGSYWKPYSTGFAGSLNGTWCASATSCFAVGDAGVFLSWNGTTWTALATEPNSDTLYAVWGTAANDIYAGGAKGAFYHWNGTSWTDTQIAADSPIRGIWGTGPTNVYAVGDVDAPNGHGTGQIWHGSGPTPGGWSAQTSLPVTVSLQAVGGTGTNNVFAVGTGGIVLQSTNGGTSWTNITSTVNVTQKLLAVSGFGVDVFAGGLGGTLVTSINSGTAWTTTATGSQSNLNAVWGTSASNVFAVGDAGTILFWNGSSLAVRTSGTTANLNGVFGTSASDIFAVGSGGTILHSTNGTTWVAQTSGTTANLASVWGTGSSDVWAVGAVGKVLHYNGTIWDSVPAARVAATSLDLGGVWGTATNNVYVVGDTGLRMLFNGTTWTAQAYDAGDSLAGFPKRYFHSVWGTSPTDVWAAADHSVIFHNDGSGLWKDQAVDGTIAIRSIFGSGPGNVYAVGDSGLIFHQNNPDLSTGGHWSLMASGAGILTLRGVYAPSLTESFVVGDAGLFLHGIQ